MLFLSLDVISLFAQQTELLTSILPLTFLGFLHLEMDYLDPPSFSSL